MSADLVSDCSSVIPPWHPKGDQKEPKGAQSAQRSSPRTVIGVTKSKTQLWLNCVLLFVAPIICLGGLLWVLCGPLGCFWSSLGSPWGALNVLGLFCLAGRCACLLNYSVRILICSACSVSHLSYAVSMLHSTFA
jgi:hypothetical protein